MANVAIAAVGAKVKWCAESTAGTRPTTGYTELTDVRSAPAVEKTKNMIECSAITDAEEAYVEGKTTFTNSGTFELVHSDAAITGWEALVTAYVAAKAAGKRVWCEYAYGSGKSYFMAIAPGSLGNAGLDENGVTVPAPCGIVYVEGWATASTT